MKKLLAASTILALATLIGAIAGAIDQVHQAVFGIGAGTGLRAPPDLAMAAAS